MGLREDPFGFCVIFSLLYTKGHYRRMSARLQIIIVLLQSYLLAVESPDLSLGFIHIAAYFNLPPRGAALPDFTSSNSGGFAKYTFLFIEKDQERFPSISL